MVSTLGYAGPSCTLHQNQKEGYVEVKLFGYENYRHNMKVYRISEELFVSLADIGGNGWCILDCRVHINNMNFDVQSFEEKFSKYVEEKKIQPILVN